MKKLGLIVSILGLSVAGAASAQTDFSGLYYGGNVDIVSGSTSDPLADWTGDGNGNHSGIGLSGFVGYNFTQGPWVFGGEIDLGYANAKGEEVCQSASWTCRTELDALASVRGRVGYVQQNNMFYGFGGVAGAKANLTTINSGGTEFPGEETLQGYVYGVGVESAVANMPGVMRLEIARYAFDATDFVNDTNYDAVEVGETVMSFGLVFGF